MRLLKQVLCCTRAAAAVETAIFAPFFLIFTFGIADLGSAMYTRMAANAATQAGAIYAIVHCSASTAAACLSGIEQAMNDATADSSFCTGTVCSASIAACADGSPKCISVSAAYPYTPMLSSALYSWAMDQAAQYTATVRVQ